METLNFETSIKCSGCIAKIKPAINQLTYVTNWEVDLQNPKKILTVIGESLNEVEIIKILEDAGFSARKT